MAGDSDKKHGIFGFGRKARSQRKVSDQPEPESRINADGTYHRDFGRDPQAFSARTKVFLAGTKNLPGADKFYGSLYFAQLIVNLILSGPSKAREKRNASRLTAEVVAARQERDRATLEDGVKYLDGLRDAQALDAGSSVRNHNIARIARLTETAIAQRRGAPEAFDYLPLVTAITERATIDAHKIQNATPTTISYTFAKLKSGAVNFAVVEISKIVIGKPTVSHEPLLRILQDAHEAVSELMPTGCISGGDHEALNRAQVVLNHGLIEPHAFFDRGRNKFSFDTTAIASLAAFRAIYAHAAGASLETVMPSVLLDDETLQNLCAADAAMALVIGHQGEAFDTPYMKMHHAAWEKAFAEQANSSRSAKFYGSA